MHKYHKNVNHWTGAFYSFLPPFLTLGGRKLGDATLHSLQTTSNNQNQVASGDLTPAHLIATALNKRNVN